LGQAPGVGAIVVVLEQIGVEVLGERGDLGHERAREGGRMSGSSWNFGGGPGCDGQTVTGAAACGRAGFGWAARMV
jgi:hypothetical protein